MRCAWTPGIRSAPRAGERHRSHPRRPSGTSSAPDRPSSSSAAGLGTISTRSCSATGGLPSHQAQDPCPRRSAGPAISRRQTLRTDQRALLAALSGLGAHLAAGESERDACCGRVGALRSEGLYGVSSVDDRIAVGRGDRRSRGITIVRPSDYRGTSTKPKNPMAPQGDGRPAACDWQPSVGSRRR